MAHALLYDNVGTMDATANDGYLSGGLSFTDADTMTNESRANDRDLTLGVSNIGVHASGTDALLFDLSSAQTVDFCAYYMSEATSLNVRVYADSATSTMVKQGDTVASSTLGWNIHTFTSASYRYWAWNSEEDRFPEVNEIYFGSALELPISGDGITIEKPYNSFVSSTYNNTEFSNKIDTELRRWTLQVPILIDSDKTSLESLQSNYKNLYTFLYYDESSYHHVRLAKPLTFNQVATNAYSTSITLQEVA